MKKATFTNKVKRKPTVSRDVFKVDVSEPEKPRKKKKVLEVEEPVRKKKKASTALTVVEAKPIVGAKKTKLGKTDMKRIKTLFGDRSEDVLELIENNNKDGAITLLYKQLLGMVVDLMPIAEGVVREAKGYKGIYQLNQMISSCREIMADIQATQDRGMLGHTIVEKYVRPAFLDIAKQMVENDYQLQSELMLSCRTTQEKQKVANSFSVTRKELGRFIQDQYMNLKEEIIKGLT